MPKPLRSIKFPGVFVQEIHSSPPPLVSVGGAEVLFLGVSEAGPLDRPVGVSGLPEFEGIFGRGAASASLARQLRLFFGNGGRRAQVLRAEPGPNLPLPAAYAAALARLAPQAPRVDVLVVVPPGDTDVPQAVWVQASLWCAQRRAMLIADAPSEWTTVDAAARGIAAWRTGIAMEATALYFPRILVREEATVRTVAPSGAIAGVWARTTDARGLWKAPAGLDATVQGMEGPSLSLRDAEIGVLNPLAINCLKLNAGSLLVWGARTVAGFEGGATESRYVPVRRLMDHVEVSVAKGLEWAVFEPNDEPLWAKVRMVVEGFLQALWRGGAMVGATPREAYWVRCDGTTMTEEDRKAGRMKILIGLAPLKPAEFVIVAVGLRVTSQA